MDPLDRDVLLFNTLFVALCGFVVVVPILYIYVRRKTAKPRANTSPVVSSGPNLLEPNPSGIEVKPAEPSRRNLPKPKQATPEQLLRSAYRAVYIAGFFIFIFGLLPLVLSRMPSSAYTATQWPNDLKNSVVGLLLLALGFLVSRRSLPALITAMVIFTLNGLFEVIMSVTNPANTNAWFCTSFWILLMLSMMYGGIGAIKKLKQAESDPSEIP